MLPALLVRIHPVGPYRYGPGHGGIDRLDTLYRSDRLYSALTLAMRDLGFLDDWLDQTARAATPAVTFSSLMPYQAETLFAPPPSAFWPPAPSLVTTSTPVFLAKLRWNAARFVPLTLIESILAGEGIIAEQWFPDPESGCLLRRDRPSTSPFRSAVRKTAAVDRLSQSAVHVDRCACVEFDPAAGLWSAVRFVSEAAESVWRSRIEAAFRLLADTGFGGRRRSGWGHADPPQFQRGAWPALLVPKLARHVKEDVAAANGRPAMYWLLSLYSPAHLDTIDWTGGSYALTIRGGRIDSAIGAGTEKKAVRMVSEGSVLRARSEPLGLALNVAPDEFPHPVYRSGFALALRLPENGFAALQEQSVEQEIEDDLAAHPCPPAEPLLFETLESVPEIPEIELPAAPEEPEPVGTTHRPALESAHSEQRDAGL